MSLHVYNIGQVHKPRLESENILPLLISVMGEEKQNNIKWLTFDSAPLVELLIIENQIFFKPIKVSRPKNGVVR